MILWYISHSCPVHHIHTFFHFTCRFDATTKEIVLQADRYLSREENRRLCLEQLHLLIREGQARVGGSLPTQGGVLSDSLFLEGSLEGSR